MVKTGNPATVLLLQKLHCHPGELMRSIKRGCPVVWTWCECNPTVQSPSYSFYNISFLNVLGSARSQANSGAQIFVNYFIQATRMSAGCFDHQNMVSDRLEICAEVHAAFDCQNSLLCRFDPKVGNDRL
jgi:hypothetical protein